MGSFNPLSLLTGGVSGLFGLGTTALNNQAEKINTDRTNATNLQIARESNALQQSENVLNREFNASEAEKAYERELEKMQIQHQFNSPIELVRQMREAGLNPASASGGDFGTSMANSGQASYHTGLSPAMPNMIKPNLQPFPNIVDGMLDGALKLAQVKKIGADTGLSEAQSNQINRTLEQSLRLLTVNADQAEFIHFLDTAFAPLERVQGFEAKKSEIAVNWQMALKLASEGELIKAKEANEKVLTGLYDAQKKLTGASADEVRERIKWMAPLNIAKINELYAGAEEARAHVDQIRELTPAQKTLMEKDAEYRTSQIKTDGELRRKIAKEILDIAEDTREQKFTNDQRDRLVKELDSQIRTGALQQKQDLYNPFKYVGGLLGGAAGSAIKVIK